MTTHANGDPASDTEPDRRQEFAAFLRSVMDRRGFDTSGFDSKGSKRSGGPSQLASRTGLALTVVLRLIRGEVVPSVPTLQRLADVLDIPLGELLLQAGLARSPQDLAIWARPDLYDDGWQAALPSAAGERVTFIREKPVVDQLGEAEELLETFAMQAYATAAADVGPPDDLPAAVDWEGAEDWERHLYYTPGLPVAVRAALAGVVRAMINPPAMQEPDEADAPTSRAHRSG